MIQRFWNNRGRTGRPRGWKVRRTLAAAILLAAALAGCTAEREIDTPIPPETGGLSAGFTLTVPGMKVPSTRALDAGKEQEIAEVDVVIFRNTDNTLAEYHRVSTVAKSGDEWQFEMNNIKTSSGITVAVIANASPEVSQALDILAKAQGSGGSYLDADKADFLEALQVSLGTKWKTDDNNYWRIPMYGELPVTNSIYAETQLKVDLTRMLAKVNVVNAADPDDFKLTAVHVVNYNTKGRIAPAWDAQGGLLPPATTPNLPSAPGKAAWVQGNELTYTVGSTQELKDEIYLFEAAAMAENTTSPDGVRLVLEGDYTSAVGTEHYFYPVDFIKTDDGTMDYIPVLRNHSYTFTIEGVKGNGYDRLGDAVAALSSPKLEVKVLTVSESGIHNIVWNGQYFLGLEDHTVTLGGDANSTTSVKVSTNYDAGWEVKTSLGNGTVIDGIVYANPADKDWLSATPGDPESAALVLTARSGNVSGALREATVHLKAERLTLSIVVTQQQASDLYVGMFGGKLTEDPNGVWQFERELYVQPGNEGGPTAKYQWDSNASVSASGLINKWNGKGNTYTLGSSPNYAAAYACYSKNGQVTGLDDPNYVWYLPAQSQLMAVWGAHPSFDAAYEFTALKNDYYYWSATESNNYYTF